MSKCKEIIGYVGDVRNIIKNHAVATNQKSIVKWVKRSKNEVFATLFYSKDDVYGVERTEKELLKINPDLKFKKISSLKVFLDYIEKGMDREEHPIKDVTMINIYSIWDKNAETIDYVEEARKRHDPEVREISQEDMNNLKGEIGKAMIKSIFTMITSNKAIVDEMTVTKAAQEIKDSYAYNQAETISKEVLSTSGAIATGPDEFKKKTEVPDMNKGSVKFTKIVGKLSFASQAYTLGETLYKTDKAFKRQKKDHKKAKKVCKSALYGEKGVEYDTLDKCIELNEHLLINMEEDVYELTGYVAFSPKNMEKVRKSNRKEKKGK